MSDISLSTFQFLAELNENNTKEWFHENKKSYEKAKKEITDFASHFLQEFSKIDATLSHLEAKNCLFRINRDVRFSNDKSPYKTNFGISMNKGGKKAFQAGYYINIQPNECFVGGGIYMPQNEDLKKIREEIDYNFDEFSNILSDAEFQNYYGGLSVDEKLILKKMPKGYEMDNPAIQYLKMKSFTAIRSYSDAEILSNSFLNECVKGMTILKPLVDFLNRAIEN